MDVFMQTNTDSLTQSLLLECPECKNAPPRQASYFPFPEDFKAIIGAIVNAGVQYNLEVISAALYLMKDEYEIEHWMKATTQSAVFAGAVVGMMTMGFLGDLVGRDKAMIVTMVFLAIGALGTALFTWGTTKSIFSTMAGFRFLLGVGSGGVYPLYAAKAIEEAGNVDHKLKSLCAAKGFFWRLPGALMIQISALILISIVPPRKLQWRILLGIGVLFPLINIIQIAFTPKVRNLEFEVARARKKKSYLKIILQKQHLQNLLITGGGWFIKDVVYYGTALAQPEIVESIWPTTTVTDHTLRSIVPLVSALPVAVFAIWILRQYGTRILQMAGFSAVSFFFILLAFVSYFESTPTYIVYITYILLYSSFWLTGISTYIISGETYRPEVRGTMTGISAALGKVGAIAGNVLFTFIMHSSGLSAALLLCGLVSVLGAATGYFMESEETRLARNIQIRRLTHSSILRLDPKQMDLAFPAPDVKNRPYASRSHPIEIENRPYVSQSYPLESNHPTSRDLYTKSTKSLDGRLSLNLSLNGDFHTPPLHEMLASHKKVFQK